MSRVPTEIIDVLKEPDLLDEMHVIAERRHTMYVVNHVMINQLAKQAFGASGELYASLGVGVQEIISDFSELETPQPAIISGMHAAGVLAAPTDRVANLLFDTLKGFHTVEPKMFDIVRDVVDAHLEVPSSRNLAMFGAALSHSMQLGRTLGDK